MDRKQNDHISTCGSSEETTEEANLFFREGNHWGFTIALACPWILETWRQACLESDIWHCSRNAGTHLKYASKSVRTQNKWKHIRTESMFKCCRLRYEKMRDDKVDLELFCNMVSCKFIKKLDILDILPHTSGRNHSSPNENIPGIWSQPQKRWQRRLARQAIFTVNHIEARIPVNYTTLISGLKKILPEMTI